MAPPNVTLRRCANLTCGSFILLGDLTDNQGGSQLTWFDEVSQRTQAFPMKEKVQELYPFVMPKEDDEKHQD